MSIITQSPASAGRVPRHIVDPATAVARTACAPARLDVRASKQRLRTISRNRSPPPAHIREQGQSDAHLISLEARPD